MHLRKRIKEVERLKEEGNKAFKSGDLADAIEKYADAIQVNYFCVGRETTVMLTELPS